MNYDDIDPELNAAETIDCPDCAGMGVQDVGDCEDGVWTDCPGCDGKGCVEL